MPGVLQLEAMAQVSSVLMLRKPENAGKIGYFMSADSVKWRRPVLPALATVEQGMRPEAQQVFTPANTRKGTAQEDGDLAAGFKAGAFNEVVLEFANQLNDGRSMR